MSFQLFSTPAQADHAQRVRTLIHFAWLMPAALFVDSLWVAERWAHGQWLTLVMMAGFYVYMQRCLTPEQRLLALVFIPVAVVGECLFTFGFRVYEYRLSNVPIYVPIGHPLLLSAGWLLLEMPWVKAHAERLRVGLLVLHVVVIAVLVLMGDTLTGTFAALGVYLFRRRPFALVYGLMGLIVLYIELLGTAFGC